MINILHTNDFHGTLNAQKVEQLREMRKAADLYFDTGDAIRAGNLAVPLSPEAAWPNLASLDCSASVLGNRESHPIEAAFMAKLAGVSHPILCANLRRKEGGCPFPSSMIFKVGSKRVGVFGLMVPIVTERMASRAVSAYLWDQPIPTAQRVVVELRPNVDLLIALTHIGYSRDRELAEAVPGIDIILGGHSHTVLNEPVRVNDTEICQGGSHGRYVGVYHWENGRLSGGLVPLKDAS
jgi:2',3'-cyclic-nucleotide 2'-phosphodiesterase (5'-nucleotidase family)